MNDEQLDALVAATAITDEQVAHLDVDAGTTDLLERIMSISTREPTATERPLRRGPRRLFAGLSMAAALALGLLFLQPLTDNTSDAWAAELVAAAEDSPLLLLDADGWTVERADIYGTEGEMTFTDGTARLDVHWRDGESFDQYIDDRAHSAASSTSLQVLGHDATLFLYDGGGNDWTTLFHDGNDTIEVRGVFADEATYRDLLERLVNVDVDAWLSAMPDSVIASADRAAVVPEMLADIPMPDGFDALALSDGPLRDRYQLGATVAGTVACAWIDQWVTAEAAGDTVAADEAIAAMQTSHDWAILNEMVDQGAYPQVLWLHADAMANNGQVPAGRPMTVTESYRDALGCDDGL